VPGAAGRDQIAFGLYLPGADIMLAALLHSAYEGERQMLFEHLDRLRKGLRHDAQVRPSCHPHDTGCVASSGRTLQGSGTMSVYLTLLLQATRQCTLVLDHVKCYCEIF
jgi:hypothetical protein